MVAFGYSLLCEQRGPRELVSDAVGAEDTGFDFAVISDHYFPWLDGQGHAPQAWPVLGAVAAATERMPLMTYVTCPIMRYHPVVVEQQAATVALLGRGVRGTVGGGVRAGGRRDGRSRTAAGAGAGLRRRSRHVRSTASPRPRAIRVR
jgi:G6PDH family F420-dependent oxidoreductase